MNVVPETLVQNITARIGLDAELRRQFAESGRVVELKTGQAFLRRGSVVDTFAMVVGGVLRVAKTGEGGREITLYTVGPGECCTVNLLCLLTGQESPVEAVVEEDLRAVLYSRDTFRRWVNESPAFRDFVHQQLAERMVGMMALVEEVAFQRMDRRLAGYLSDKVERGGAAQLCLTHEAVATDLGTAREVVSRLLKCFEKRGLVELSRGRITVTDAARLRDAEL